MDSQGPNQIWILAKWENDQEVKLGAGLKDRS